ncbi:iron-containing redox enzyme family protein [Pseudomonas borbori]
MTTLTRISIERPTASSMHATGGQAKEVYAALMDVTDQSLELARDFLHAQLQQASKITCDLPSDPAQLSEWVTEGARKTTDTYSRYLEGRKQGKPRRYFSTRAHALYFLREVAPTKLVDGAWLYGLLPRWNDVRFHGLIRTYLEELGDGVPAQNHVLIYKKLLATYGCDDLSTLSDEHYLQGAQQLALGYLADEFLPELIGYNLGYEQLPLHLLISTFELNELDIDPYYFQLHITIDNASTGHAHKAAQAVLDNLPVVGDAKDFYRRVALGYRLNDIGLNSTGAIAAFDLEQELLAMFDRKRAVAGMVHSDFCRIEGRTVNQWLSQPGQIGDFLDALQTRGWIRRHEDPQQSRFWHLVQGEQAAMFGVFSAYELQLLHDWIAGDWLEQQASPTRPIRFRAMRRPATGQAPAREGYVPSSDFDNELATLDKQLRVLNEPAQMARLIDLMSPAHHSTPAGLMATRMFVGLMR